MGVENNDPSDVSDGTRGDHTIHDDEGEEEPSLDPYFGRLERFELFSTNQCYYLVGCNKLNTMYRMLKLDRTLIERPPTASSTRGAQQPARGASVPVSDASTMPSPKKPPHSPVPAADAAPALEAENSHQAKPTLRPLSEFLIEDPNVYTQQEIKEMLDMIHDGNFAPFSHEQSARAHSPVTNGPPANQASRNSRGNGSGGLKPIVKAYGIVGFVRFLDCYYLTLITRRAKVGSLGGNPIYTIKVSEIFEGNGDAAYFF
jgi:SacI homology domain